MTIINFACLSIYFDLHPYKHYIPHEYRIHILLSSFKFLSMHFEYKIIKLNEFILMTNYVSDIFQGIICHSD